MMYASVNTIIAPETPVIRLNRIVGVSSGSVIAVNCFIRPAPSMRAASYRVEGMFRRPAR